MASVYPKIKDGKIVSFKFKAFLGRDENGKQIIRCTTWTPDRIMSEKKLHQLAEKKAVIWEREAQEQYENDKNSFQPKNISFEAFVNIRFNVLRWCLSVCADSEVSFFVRYVFRK